MDQNKSVHALLHIRKLRGGSQPILVRASDGFFYIVKFLNNLQGYNVLFNEVLGTELFRSVGLLVPEWRPIFLSEDFIAHNPACWMETEHGPLRPKAGWSFGSRFVGLRNSNIFEILPAQRFSRIENRKDFWKAWILDILCGHSDHRQAVFLEKNSGALEAHFIDHGHLLGGAKGNDNPSILASRYIDPRIYPDIAPEDVADILSAFCAIDWAAISHVACSLPTEWNSEEAASRLNRLIRKVSDPALVKSAVRFLVDKLTHAEGSHARRLERSSIQFNRAALRDQILPARVDPRFDFLQSDIACGQRQRRTQALCASCPEAACL